MENAKLVYIKNFIKSKKHTHKNQEDIDEAKCYANELKNEFNKLIKSNKNEPKNNEQLSKGSSKRY